MERRRNAAEVVCKICGEAFILPEEDEVDGKLPRTLLCSHVFCTCCLLSMENTGVIQCPECEVDSVLPEGGVLALLEDSGIIGLLYMSKISKMRIEKQHISGSSTPSDVNGNSEIMEQPNRYKKTMEAVEEALAKAVEKHDQLMKEHEMLKVGLDKQIRRENVRLSTEINLVVAKAVKAVRKWGDTQHNHLSNLEALFSKSQNQVDLVEEKIKFLENAMEKTVQLRHLSSLELNGDFKKVLETLETALEPYSFNVECISLDSGIRCVFRSEGQDACLSLSLKLETTTPKILPESPCQQCEIIGKKCPWQVEDGLNKTKSSGVLCPSKGGPLSTQSASSSSPKSHQGMERLNVSIHGSTVDLLNPDVIIEEISEEIKNPFTSRPIQTKKKGTSKKGKKHSSDSRKVLQWVSVTHVVNPSFFYIRHVTETKEQVKLSTRINSICKETNCSFSSADTLERGNDIFFKWEEKWCRAIVMELFDSCHSGVVEACPISECTGMKVFLLDYGPTVSVKPNSDDGNEWTLKEISNQIKMVGDEEKFELSSFAPQAVRCCLKNIVPKNQTLGWCSEAQQTFLNLVSGSVVQMEALGQDGESSLVDLKKTMVDQSANGPMSLREYLVFSDLARFDSLLSSRREGFYPPINPRINQEYNAVVSHINNPDDFHTQLVDNMEYLMLSANLQDCYNTTSIAEDESLTVACPVIGQACVARYEDNLWYRAQIIGHPEAAKVNVKYVDFGNTKIISVCNLRKIKEEFFSLPSMAIHCCLSDIVPLDGKTWSEACTNRFISLAHQKLVTLVIAEKVSNNRPHPVKLFESDVNSLQSNIADTLVKEDLAFLREGNHFESSMTLRAENAVWDSPLDLSTPKSIEVVEKNVEDQDKKKSALEPSLMFPQQLRDIKVRVSHVSSPSRFYVQIAEYDQQLKSLSELLRREYMLTEPINIEWKKDMFCAAYINGIWDRVQILSDAPSRGMEEVIRCDYGNETKVNIDQLRLLPSSLNGSFALECTLTDIRPAGGGATWTATACDFLSHFLSGSSAVMTIKEATDKRPVPVTLSCFNRSGQFVSISDVLTSEGLALRDKKPPSRECLVQVPNDDKVPVKIPANGVDSNTTDFPTPAIFTSHPMATPRAAPRLKVTAEKVETGLYQPPKLPPTGHIQAVICAIDEDGLLYARTKNMEYDLCILRERIWQNIRSPPRPNLYTWRSVKGCTVFGPDMVWYRAQVLEVLGGHLKVQYVDYGLVENIPMVHAHPLLLCVDVPQLCVPCQLRDVNPLHAIGVMKEMLQNRPVDMNVLELPADPRAPVLIEIFLDGQKLSKIMFYNKNSSMCTSLSVSPPLGDWSIEVENLKVQSKQTLEVFIGPAPLPVNSCFKVTIRHLLTPNELYLCPTEGVKEHRVAGETLEEALSRINENIDALPRVMCITAEAQCLAEYIDGKYYRAKVLRLVSVEPVLVMVQHVDFGSDDTLPLSKLRQMPAELLQFPVQVVKVYVASLKPPRVQQEGEVLPYSPQWGMKAVTTMIQLLHSNISATVVTPKPKLTVELTNHQGELVHLPLLSCGLAELD